MSDELFWRRLWTLRDAAGQAGAALYTGNAFWLEPHFSGNGDLAYCDLRFDQGMMDPRWRTQLRPAGMSSLPNPLLPVWNSTDAAVRKRYMSVALGIAADANVSMFRRLEGYFDPTGQPELARLFVLSGAQPDGRDWLILDLTNGSRDLQDGTGHGDSRI